MEDDFVRGTIVWRSRMIKGFIRVRGKLMIVVVSMILASDLSSVIRKYYGNYTRISYTK